MLSQMDSKQKTMRSVDNITGSVQLSQSDRLSPMLSPDKPKDRPKSSKVKPHNMQGFEPKKNKRKNKTRNDINELKERQNEELKRRIEEEQRLEAEREEMLSKIDNPAEKKRL